MYGFRSSTSDQLRTDWEKGSQTKKRKRYACFCALFLSAFEFLRNHQSCQTKSLHSSNQLRPFFDGANLVRCFFSLSLSFQCSLPILPRSWMEESEKGSGRWETRSRRERMEQEAELRRWEMQAQISFLFSVLFSDECSPIEGPPPEPMLPRAARTTLIVPRTSYLAACLGKPFLFSFIPSLVQLPFTSLFVLLIRHSSLFSTMFHFHFIIFESWHFCW